MSGEELTMVVVAAGDRLAERGEAGGYPTKSCPRCGAELYADMHVCYGCLYDFSRDVPRRLPGMPELPGAPQRPAAADDAPYETPGDTLDLSAVAGQTGGPVPGAPGLGVRTSACDVWCPVPEGGVTVGRDARNDIVLHAPAVSRRHLRARPTPDGMEVTDLGSTNPARHRGHDITGSVVVPYGEVVDVCGCLLVMTGTASDASRAAQRASAGQEAV